MSPIIALIAGQAVTADSDPARHPIPSRLLCLLTAWRQRRRDRLTCRVLEALDDRTLHDIGPDRSEIASVVATRARDRHAPRFDLV